MDLAPGREDGYDLSDWLAERDSESPANLLAALSALVVDRDAGEQAVR